MVVQRKRSQPTATYEELLALPEHQVGEILNGELVVSPRPASRHAVAHTSLSELLGPFRKGRKGPGGWWILTEPELHFGSDVLVPDIGGWLIERMPTLPEAAYFSLAPDWVCEVLSPSTARIDRQQKLPIYAREKVKHVWLVDPVSKTLEVFRLNGKSWTLASNHVGDVKVRAEPFEAIALNLALLWVD
jgi:Uma2 family endonuclease